jgi:hypothetical protein
MRPLGVKKSESMASEREAFETAAVAAVHSTGLKPGVNKIDALMCAAGHFINTGF